MKKRDKLITICCLILFIFIILFITNTSNFKSSESYNLLNYSNGEISFQYPSNLKIINQNKDSHFVIFEDSKTKEKISVNKQVSPTNYNLKNVVLSNPENINFKLKSLKNKEINGFSMKEISYEVANSLNDSDFIRSEKWVEKDGAIYSIISIKPKNSENIIESNENIISKLFNSLNIQNTILKENNEDIIFNSLNIQNTNNTKDQEQFWGEIAIPTLSVNWKIGSDTVNSYGSVYHYNDSYFFGQNGTSGLLGHHTSYSAPFDNINTLKKGDKIIIKDFLSQKKYIYEVNSNGDINYDYKKNPVKFPSGSSNLTMVTCWPKGTENAAWQVYCKLIAIENL